MIERIKRYKSIPRRSSPKKANRKRKAANLLRAHGLPDRRKWTKAQPCYVCGRTPSDAAHMRSGGVSRKSGASQTVPLCASNPATGYVGHHDEFDAGKQTFAAAHDFDRDEAARVTEARYQAFIADLAA